LPRSSRVGPRRSSGEASAGRERSVDIETEITALAKWEIQELRAEWRKLYRAEPPKRLSRDLLLRAIAYRIQERTHGGLGLAIQRRLNALTSRRKVPRIFLRKPSSNPAPSWFANGTAAPIP
jgi:hypothetical protein